jgi:uncharacterized MAPEG superfamily protein
MSAVLEALPALAEYRLAFVVLAALALMTMVQALLTAPLGFIKEEQVPGMPLNLDHSALSFRALRTHSNSAENVPVFAVTVMVAVVAGVGPVWVQGIAVAYLVCRLAFWGIYYAGVGKVAGGPRTLAFVGGMLCNIALAVMAIVALI